MTVSQNMECKHKWRFVDRCWFEFQHAIHVYYCTKCGLHKDIIYRNCYPGWISSDKEEFFK